MTSTTEVFTPFSAKSISFLRQLKRNNDRDWFEERRDQYLETLKAPCESFISAVRAPLQKKFPRVRVDRRCVSRIYRDTRFSPDKSPYKSYVSFLFRDTEVKDDEGPAVYMGFDPTGLSFGCGIFAFSKPARDHFRTLVSESPSDKEFRKVLAVATRAGFEPSDRELKRIPAGFDPSHRNAEFLMHNGLYMRKEIDMPKEFYSPRFADYFVKTVSSCAPFFEWMKAFAKSAPAHPGRFISSSNESSGRGFRSSALDDLA